MRLPAGERLSQSARACRAVAEEVRVRIGPVSRRQALAVLGGAGALVAGRLLLTRGSTAGKPVSSGYAPDDLAGRAAAFPLSAVRLLDSPFRANQSRNTAYLLFLDPERMLRSFRINYGLPAGAQPCGGWEAPDSEIRGHTTGHLLSGLALTYANTGNEAARAKGRYLVGRLAALQARAPPAGYHPATCRRSRRATSTGWRPGCQRGRRIT